MEIISPVTDMKPTLHNMSLRFPISENELRVTLPSSPIAIDTDPVEKNTNDYDNFSSNASEHFHSTHQYSSTNRHHNSPVHPPMDLSNLQATPTKVRGEDQTILRRDGDPSSISPQSALELHFGSKELEHNSELRTLSNPSSDDFHSLTEEQAKALQPDWTHVLQSLANIYAGKPFLPPSTEFQSFPVAMQESHNNTISDSSNQSVNSTTGFQSLLANINQFLFNSSVTSGLDGKMTSPTFEENTNELGFQQNINVQANRNKSSMFDSMNPVNFQMCSPNRSRSGNQLSPPIEMTSTSIFNNSLLALFSGNKPGIEQSPDAERNLFLSPQLSPRSEMNPMSFPFSSMTTTNNHSNVSTASNIGLPNPTIGNGPINSAANSRDFLYQLGQRLMALAASPGFSDAHTNPQQSEWNQSVGDPSSLIPSTSFNSTSNPFLTGQMGAFMSSLLFKSPKLASTKNSSPSEKQNSTYNSLKPVGFDKTMSHLPVSATSLSGISMRGNQKYSAYYQHQRKQGFNVGFSNDLGNQCYSRRASGSSNSNTSYRYGGRRFRTGINSGMEGRTTNRSGTRNLPNSLNNASYRGHSFKNSIVNQSGTAHLKPPISESFLAVAAAAAAAANGQSEPSTTGHRHRDTAFLCSCGKDFESLYNFTVHMKDTGHKPISDQAERDIPKLVRGQDMWINSETEQTREILRCMRCHQSFRNLPELTMHMMKTNHYSEIVYNDSGRLVFVNPDDHRRGSSIMPSSSSYSGSTGKMPTSPPGFPPGRRAGRAVPCSTSTSITQNNYNELLSNELNEEKPSGKNLNTSSSCTSDKSNEHDDSVETKMKVSAHKVSQPATPENTNQLTTNSIPISTEKENAFDDNIFLAPKSSDSEKTDAFIPVSCAESPGDQSYKSNGSSVLQQIESFVENNFPRTGKNSLTKLDNYGSAITKPPCSSPSTSSYTESFTWETDTVATQAVGHESVRSSARKRTHSESNTSIYNAQSASSSDELEVNGQHECPLKKVSLSPNSTACINAKVSSPKLLENPLSSLQKLVETTHKPVPPSAAFSTAVSSSLFVSCNSSISSSKPQNSSSRMASGQSMPYQILSTCVRSQNSPSTSSQLASGGSSHSCTSFGSQFSQMISPVTGDSETLVPALSALYAYVEKTSSHQIQESNSQIKQDDLASNSSIDSGRSPVFSHNEGKGEETSHQSSSPSQLFNHFGGTSNSLFNIQAAYTAIMSGLTTQLLGSQTPEIQNYKQNNIEESDSVFRSMAEQFRDSIESTLGNCGKLPENDVITNWMKMMNALNKANQKPSTCGSPDVESCTATIPSNQSSPHTGKQSAHNDEADNCKSHEQLLGDGTLLSTKQLPVPISHCLSNASLTSLAPPSCTIDTSTTVVSNGKPTINYRTSIQNRYTSSTVNRSLGACSSTNLMSNMITKKAKCHFCGKPFANKGQVRLHISKNKCPCLLQQSCHVAALAAAFGSETRSSPGQSMNKQPTNTGIATSNPLGTLANDKIPVSSVFNRTVSSGSYSEAPSALSLLKDRFQNFDPLRTPVKATVNTSSHDTNPLISGSHANSFGSSSIAMTPYSSSKMSFPPVPYPSEAWFNWCQSTKTSNLQSDQRDNQKDSADPASAAENAGHLAAMALLAQALVQMTSLPNILTANHCSIPEVSNVSPTNFSDKSLQNSNSKMNMPLPFPTAGNINLNALFNQVSTAKPFLSPNAGYRGMDSDEQDQNSPITTRQVRQRNTSSKLT